MFLAYVTIVIQVTIVTFETFITQGSVVNFETFVTHVTLVTVETFVSLVTVALVTAVTKIVTIVTTETILTCQNVSNSYQQFIFKLLINEFVNRSNVHAQQHDSNYKRFCVMGAG